MNASEDARIGVVAFGDGTLRWYRLSDGHELLALYPHPDKKRWVLWTPGGYYDCSPGGEELIGWHVNNGPDREADFYPASRFRSQYYRPDVISKVLGTLDEERAVREANEIRAGAVAVVPPPAPPVAQILPPIVEGVKGAWTGGVLKLNFTLRSQTAEKVSRIDVYANGVLAKTEELSLDATKPVAHEVTIDAPPGAVIAVQAWNRFSPSVLARLESAAQRATDATAPPRAEVPRKGTLWVLAVGVGEFEKNPALRLAFPGKDARDFAAAMAEQRPMYADVRTRVLSDRGATKTAVLDGFQWLEDGVAKGDVAMVYLAGHGTQSASGSYFFLPTDYDVDHRVASAVNFSDLFATVRVLRNRGHIFVFLDTCHASAALGTVDSTGLSGELAAPETGAVVLSACQANQTASKDPRWGNGAFTHVLLKALRGAAPTDDEGGISLSAVQLYLENEVPKLVGKDRLQQPTVQLPGPTPKLLLARRSR